MSSMFSEAQLCNKHCQQNPNKVQIFPFSLALQLCTLLIQTSSLHSNNQKPRTPKTAKTSDKIWCLPFSLSLQLFTLLIQDGRLNPKEGQGG